MDLECISSGACQVQQLFRTPANGSRFGIFTAGAQAKESHMRAVNFKSGLILELLKKRGELFVIDLHGVSAAPADQVMMVVPGGFVNEVPITDVGDQGQMVLHQELERAVHCGLCQPGEAMYGALVNRCGRHVPPIFLQDLQDCQSLGCQAVALFA